MCQKEKIPEKYLLKDDQLLSPYCVILLIKSVMKKMQIY
jgi:hypothetical protein